jgi:hypothetical protein
MEWRDPPLHPEPWLHCPYVADSPHPGSLSIYVSSAQNRLPLLRRFRIFRDSRNSGNSGIQKIPGIQEIQEIQGVQELKEFREFSKFRNCILGVGDPITSSISDP